MPITNKTVMPRGVRKVSEAILAPNRALIVTEEDANKLSWDEIPYGTIKVNPHTGVMSVKLKDVLLTKDGDMLENAIVKDGKVVRFDGKPITNKKGVQYSENDIEYSSETSWMPSGIKNDGTICISRDTIICEEKFTIITPDTRTAQGGAGFVCENDKGEKRTFNKINNSFVFELEKGSYIPKRNYMEIWIDNILRRDSNSGVVHEISERKVGLQENLVTGQVVTIKYAKVFRIGNPYPRVFAIKDEPDTAENGDLWIDLEKDPVIGDGLAKDLKLISWSQLVDVPKTLEGLGITEELAYKNHTHYVKDIIDFPASMTANGGNSDTVQGRTPGTEKGNIAVIESNGRIAKKVMPILSKADILDFPEAIKASGGDADTIQGRTIGTSIDNIVVVEKDNKIAKKLIPDLEVKNIKDFPKAMPADGGNAKTLDGHYVGNEANNIPFIGIDGKLSRDIMPKVSKTIISDFPESLKAEGGRADLADVATKAKDSEKLQGREVGLKANNILALDENGKIPQKALPPIKNDIKEFEGIIVGETASDDAPIGTIWFDTKDRAIRFKTTSQWVSFGNRPTIETYDD